MAQDCEAKAQESAGSFQAARWCSSGKKAEKESEITDSYFAAASFVELAGAAPFYPCGLEYDMVLQRMRDTECTAHGVLQKMQKALGRSLDSPQEKDQQEQKQISKIQTRGSADGEDRRELGHVPWPSSMGSVDTFQVDSLSYGHSSSKRGRIIVAASASFASTTSDLERGGGRASVFRRDETPGAPSWIAGDENCSARRDVREDAKPCAERAEAGICEGTFTWTFESAQQITSPGNKCGKKGPRSRCGMGFLCGQDQRKGETACNAVPRVSCQFAGDLQSEIERTSAGQRGGIHSLSKPFGTAASRIAHNVRAARCSTATSGSADELRRRRKDWRGHRFDRCSHGRRSGTSGRWLRWYGQQSLTKSNEALSVSRLSIWGSQDASQAEGEQGDQGQTQGEGTERRQVDCTSTDDDVENTARTWSFLDFTHNDEIFHDELRHAGSSISCDTSLSLRPWESQLEAYNHNAIQQHRHAGSSISCDTSLSLRPWESQLEAYNHNAIQQHDTLSSVSIFNSKFEPPVFGDGSFGLEKVCGGHRQESAFQASVHDKAYGMVLFADMATTLESLDSAQTWTKRCRQRDDIQTCDCHLKVCGCTLGSGGDAISRKPILRNRGEVNVDLPRFQGDEATIDVVDEIFHDELRHAGSSISCDTSLSLRPWESQLEAYNHNAIQQHRHAGSSISCDTSLSLRPWESQLEAYDHNAIQQHDTLSSVSIFNSKFEPPVFGDGSFGLEKVCGGHRQESAYQASVHDKAYGMVLFADMATTLESLDSAQTWTKRCRQRDDIQTCDCHLKVCGCTLGSGGDAISRKPILRNRGEVNVVLPRFQGDETTIDVVDDIYSKFELGVGCGRLDDVVSQLQTEMQSTLRDLEEEFAWNGLSSAVGHVGCPDLKEDRNYPYCHAIASLSDKQPFDDGAFEMDENDVSGFGLLRGCGEDNSDLPDPQAHGVHSKDGGLWESDSAKPPYRKSSLKGRGESEHQVEVGCKRVRFDTSITLICFQEDCSISVEIEGENFHSCCRSLWHLHGQIAEFSVFTDVFACLSRKVNEVDIEQNRQDHSSVERTAGNERSELESNSGEQVWTNDDLDTLRCLQNNMPAKGAMPFFADTWFVAEGRFHLCVQSRRMKLDPSFVQSRAAFERQCRALWLDRDDGSRVSFHVIDNVPMRLPATKFHVVMVQGSTVGHDWTMLYSTILPPLYQRRVVLFPHGVSVNDFFRLAQVEGACTNLARSCYLRFVQDGQEFFCSNQEPVCIPMNKHVEGGIRIIEEGSDERSDTESGSVAPNTVPDSESEDDDDALSFMSTAPVTFQFDLGNHYPWWDDGLEEMDENELQQEQDPDHYTVNFAQGHQGLLQDEVDHIRLMQGEDDTPWLAVTYGMGLTDLGRRDIQFDPWHLEALPDLIQQAWQEFAVYADLLIFNVHPQPIDVIGARAVALLVVVDTPDSLNEDLRNVLVIEQAASDVGARRHPYAARLAAETTDRDILAQLNLQHHCPPIALRPCHVRLGTIHMDTGQLYEFDHGTLCRTWIGNIFSQVIEAEEHISAVDAFFLQVHSLLEMRGSRTDIVCHVHGITPANRPLGHREVIIDSDWLYDLEWIDRMRVLWPFGDENVGLVFAQSATLDMHENEKIVFHFIAKYGTNEGQPILVNQQIVAVDEMQYDPQSANEFWAISVPPGEIGPNIVGVLQDFPFWFSYARSQNVYPHLVVNGQTIIEIHQSWRPGDVLRARYIVWKRHHVLTMLLGAAQQEQEVPLEHTSFLQLPRQAQQGDVIEDSFTEVCHAIMTQHVDAVQVDDSVPQSPKQQFEGETERAVHLNKDLKDIEATLSHMMNEPWIGLNTDFLVIPQLHPIAQAACECTEVSRDTTNVFHIFTDGSCKNGDAAWSFVVLCECNSGSQRRFVRIGYAAGKVDCGIGQTENTAQDAEATALIAAANFLLTKRDIDHLVVHFHFDATAVGKGSFGLTRVIQQVPEVSERQMDARVMISLLQRKASKVQGLHVHAHEGQPWNEFADSVAGLVRRGWSPPIAAVLTCGPLLRHSLAHWAWLFIAPDEELPRLDVILENDSPDAFQGNIDSTLEEKFPHDPGQEHRNVLRIATVNVGTLEQSQVVPGTSVSHKTHEILQQILQEQIHVVAVQEGRARHSRTVHHGPFTCFVGAAQTGVGGVELWINGEEISRVFEVPFDPQQDACVWYANHRIMAVRAHIGDQTIEFVVCYAPQRARPAHEIHAWWDELELVLRQRARDSMCLMMGDFNCKIGSINSDAIGSAGADLEDLAGGRLRCCCEQFDLAVPSTWDTLHQGEHWTFCSSRGSKSRLDYIAVSNEQMSAVIASYVHDDIDVLNGERDHRVLVLEMGLVAKSQHHRMRIRKPMYNRQHARNSKNRGQAGLLHSLLFLQLEEGCQ